MSFRYMKRPGPLEQSTPTTHRVATAARAPTHTAHPAYSDAYIYLRQLLRGRLPADVTEAEIRTAEEYRSYMDHNLVWQWELHVTETEAIAACRLILEELAAGRHVSWPDDARTYILSVKTIAGMKAAAPWDMVAPRESTPALTVAPAPERVLAPPGPTPGPEPHPPGPEPPGPQPRERRIVTPPVQPSEEEKTWRRRIEEAERVVEELRRSGDELADELEEHVERARDLFAVATSAVAAATVFIFLPGNAATGAAALAELARELDEIDRIREGLQEYGPRDAQRLGIKRREHHHVFPQEHRAWFEERAFEIDDYTIELDDAEHDVIHLLGWNEKMMERLKEREEELGRRLTPAEIVAVGREMMRRYSLTEPFVPYRGSEGDVVEEKVWR